MAEWKSQTVPLEYPITVGATTYSSVVLREPDTDAITLIEEAGFQEGVQPTQRQLRASVQALSKLPDDIIGRLHPNDFKRCVEASVPLLSGQTGSDDPPGSGGTSSTESAPTVATG